MIKYIG